MPYSLLTFGTVNRSAEKRCVRFFILFISLRTEKCEDFRRCHGEWLLGHGHSTGHVVVFSAFFFFFFYRMETIHLANAKAGTRTHCPGFLLSRALSFVNAELHNIQPTLTYQQYRHKVWDAWDHNALAFLRSSVLKRLFSHSPRGFFHSLSLSGCPKALGPCRAARVE